MIWIKNAVRYNRPDNPNVIKGWHDHWDNVPECGLKAEAYQHLKLFTEQLGEPFLKAFRKGCSNGLVNGLANQEQEQEQEQEQDKINDAPSGAPISGTDLGTKPNQPTLAPSLPFTDVSDSEGSDVPDDIAKPVKAPSDAGKEMSEKVQRVWNYYLAGWKKHCQRGKPPVLTEVRKRKIRARFKEGFSEEDLTRACDGLWGHRWHIENGQTSPDLLFRDAKHVEQFQGYLEAPNGGNGANKVQPMGGYDVSQWGIEYGEEE